MQVRATLEDRYDEVLTDGALALVGRLHEELDAPPPGAAGGAAATCQSGSTRASRSTS